MPKPKAETARKNGEFVRKVGESVRKKAKRSALPQNGTDNSDLQSEDLDEVPGSPNVSDTDSKKSMMDIEDESTQPPDFGGDMSQLLVKFSSDLNKTMMAKKRKLEQFTQESTRSTTKKVLETNKIQSAERKKLIDHFQNQLNSVIQQSESEIEKIRDAEDKLQKVLVQQQKHQQQLRISHGQRLKTLKSLSEEFCKGMNELEENHVEQFSAVHGELRKEMALLQKKILMDIQQQEMMNVRKHLKTILP
ncbi:hypothetical protein JTE90_023714 [Oedothorax gibbosus]|uniref:XLR/SYCP3/FAM9 domain-containing protein n=1 Tax=Oedothorax gibbosus TaxID=931172 RepID=A0AAV6VAH5_9ARAC|nr:hypothetical protein JTE90_023714 [Oedothorax gibbosus]